VRDESSESESLGDTDEDDEEDEDEDEDDKLHNKMKGYHKKKYKKIAYLEELLPE
jgi:Zn-finger nucleic acid-binding protein